MNASTIAATVASMLIVTACGSSSPSDSDETVPASANDTEVDGDASCVVALHGKGGDGEDPSVVDGVTLVSPRGNDEGWGGRQWNYLDDASYADAVEVVADSIDEAGCSVVAVRGFSNGGAFAAKLLCQGETFGARLVGVVIDDPVADEATQGCSPGANVEAALYWTGALESTAPAGTDCGPIDWTCDGDVVVGIDAFASAAGLEVMASPFDEHLPYTDAPEPAMWLDAATSQS